MGSEEIEGGSENVISPEEFSDIEKDERDMEKKRAGPFRFLQKKGREGSAYESPVAGAQGEGSSLTDLSLRLERFGGRVEILEEGRKETEARLSDISEKIGELRSSLIERDRTFSDISVKFERLQDIAQDLEPQKLTRELAKRQQELEQSKAQTESNTEKIDSILRKMKDMGEDLEKIRGFKDLVSVAEELDKKVKMVDSLKRDTERVAGKFETRLYEMNEALSRTRSNLEKVNSNEDALRELMRAQDELSLKVENLAKRDELGSSEKKFEKSFEELRFDMESHISELANALKNKEAKQASVADKESLKKMEGLANSLLEENKKLASRLENIEKKAGNIDKLESEISRISKLGGEKHGGAKLSEQIEAIQQKDREEANRRISELELRILELSKSVDHRIERRVTQESRNAREAISAPAVEEARIAEWPQPRRPAVADSRLKAQSPASSVSPGFSREGINAMIQDIYRNLDEGNITAARGQFIRLLSAYERTEDSNPFVLAKITDLHGKLKEFG